MAGAGTGARWGVAAAWEEAGWEVEARVAAEWVAEGLEAAGRVAVALEVVATAEAGAVRVGVEWAAEVKGSEEVVRERGQRVMGEAMGEEEVVSAHQ